ncbi:MAG: ribonuclease III [Synergistaceae bacterium]|jgi:ribonuclease-3|nr:ribonuclease III [Synergistaceae bacterium]
MDDVMSSSELGALEENLGYSFTRRSLLEEALTHASYANESGAPFCNERLEYLGDAVLELCVSEMLYAGYPDYSEGDLTRARASVVSETPLASWARRARIHCVIRLSKGLERQGGRKNPSILADAMEATLGAVFLDGGYGAARSVVQRFVESVGVTIDDDSRDFKSRLQEMVQARWVHPPVYRLTNRSGPDHAASFEVEVSLPNGRVIATGEGPSIKAAGFAAAESAISVLTGMKAES